jgi:Rrf2 family cysteine metabolism transcriptional repressor
MRISSRGEYGLRALLDLAQRYGKDPVTSADIASRQQIPEAYLNQLLIVLRKAGLVKSTRGPKGGHELAYPPDRITMADAILALEGSYSPVDDLDVPLPLEAPPEADILRGVWRQIDAVVGQVLESTTLGDLCQRKLARDQQIMYYI